MRYYAVLSLAFCVFSGTSLTAQEIAYPGIAWGTPAAEAAITLASGGFRFERTDQDGDQVFRHEDGRSLWLLLQADRVVGVQHTEPGSEDKVGVRFTEVADSLTAQHGSASGVNQRHTRSWSVGRVEILLEARSDNGAHYLRTEYYGPGWNDESARRQGLSPPPPGYTIVNLSHLGLRVAVDTSATRRVEGGLRTRFRVQYPNPVTADDDQFDEVEYEMEFDCARRRTRLVSRTTFLDGRQIGRVSPQGQAWSVPQQPEGHYARGLDAVCRTVRSA